MLSRPDFQRKTDAKFPTIRKSLPELREPAAVTANNLLYLAMILAHLTDVHVKRGPAV
jgi:hypothetical protein